MLDKMIVSRRRLLIFPFAASLPVSMPAFASEGFTVTDVAGREVHFDRRPQRFIVANYILNFLLIGGEQSVAKIVGMTQDGWERMRHGEYQVLTDGIPALKSIPSIGGYHDNVLNAEKIIALKPDVILMNTSQYADNSARIAVWEKAGIKTVVLDYHAMKIENHLKSTEIIGRLLGCEAEAKALTDRYRTATATVKARLAEIPESEKHRRVYVECASKGVGLLGNSYNKDVLWGGILRELEAGNIAADMPRPWGALDREFILARNPQTIVLAGSLWDNGHEGDSLTMGLTVKPETAQARLRGFMNRPHWDRLDAVKTGNVFAVDHGGLRSILDYVFTLALVQALYPAYFKDVDPDGEYRRVLESRLPSVKADGTFFLQAKKD